jgi:lysophospholipase L1-like esterase
MLFIGDSITHFWELQAYFGGAGRILINRGVGGDVSTYVRKRFEADALQLKPKLIVMKIGCNDLGWMLETLDDSIVDTICENVAAMAEQSRVAGIPLAMCSILPIWGPSWYPVEEFIDHKSVQILEANSRLKEIAEETGAIYVDYHSHMLDATGRLIKSYSDDGVHPHALGYAVMARVLKETLAKHGLWE